MKVNSPKAMEVGRKVLREFGGSWERVRQAGEVRDDGIIVIRSRAGSAISKDSAPHKPKRG